MLCLFEGGQTLCRSRAGESISNLFKGCFRFSFTTNLDSQGAWKNPPVHCDDV